MHLKERKHPLKKNYRHLSFMVNRSAKSFYTAKMCKPQLHRKRSNSHRWHTSTFILHFCVFQFPGIWLRAAIACHTWQQSQINLWFPFWLQSDRYRLKILWVICIIRGSIKLHRKQFGGEIGKEHVDFALSGK